MILQHVLLCGSQSERKLVHPEFMHTAHNCKGKGRWNVKELCNSLLKFANSMIQ